MKHNPWILMLWVFGVALIVASWSGTIWQSSFFTGYSNEQNVGPVVEFLQRLVDTMSYPTMIVGFATIAGLLFLHARNHARKVRRESSR